MTVSDGLKSLFQHNGIDAVGRTFPLELGIGTSVLFSFGACFLGLCRSILYGVFLGFHWSGEGGDQ